MNIWCVGRNYAEHAKELNNPVEKTTPLIFLKAGSGIVPSGSTFSLPPLESQIHHELELALRFGPDLRFDAMTVALDLTARQTQDDLKAKSHPWTLAKCFINSCPLGPWVPLAADLSSLKMRLLVNKAMRQEGQTSDMIFPPEDLRKYILKVFPVVPGDLLLTGTPKGIGPIASGDLLEATLEGHTQAQWLVS